MSFLLYHCWCFILEFYLIYAPCRLTVFERSWRTIWLIDWDCDVLQINVTLRCFQMMIIGYFISYSRKLVLYSAHLFPSRLQDDLSLQEREEVANVSRWFAFTQSRLLPLEPPFRFQRLALYSWVRNRILTKIITVLSIHIGTRM